MSNGLSFVPPRPGADARSITSPSSSEIPDPVHPFAVAAPAPGAVAIRNRPDTTPASKKHNARRIGPTPLPRCVHHKHAPAVGKGLVTGGSRSAGVATHELEHRVAVPLGLHRPDA